MDKKNYAALQCLEVLLLKVRPGSNLQSMLGAGSAARCEEDTPGLLQELCQQQNLRPEVYRQREEFADSYAGPALLRLQNQTWILLWNTLQLREDRVAIYDPLAGAADKNLLVAPGQLLERAGDCWLIFRNFQEVDPQKQSGLFCLASIANHHNIKMDIRRVMHDYAVDEDEPRENLLLEIAKNYQLKTRKTSYSWEQMTALEQAFPAIGRKHNGKYTVLCGIRKGQAGEELAVIDPENPNLAMNKFLFLSREQYQKELSDEVILLKKVYKLSDTDRPFDLTWFLPEFFKLRGIFTQIAIVVALITLLSLVVPLFFQIVVDRVLVNKATYTLNVLALGIVAAVIFNSFLDFIRSYFLLFATNKIDIATATKTYRHLLRLPIDFFERVPSGVLLKHMQQTEKIRGFLSGNLFFTILELFSLIIFIPFLLFYSVELTLIVLGFSALMALVIACLIKPFQRRLDELYQAEGRRQSMLVESIHGMRTVKSLSLEPVEEKHWDDITAYAVKSYFKVGKISMSAKSISQMLEMLMNITVIWAGAHFVFDYKITIGALIAFQMLSGRVTGPLVKLIGLIHEYQQIALSVKMLGVVMNTPAEPAGGGIRNPLRGDIAFENVTFQYRPDLPAVISQFSVQIPQGTTLGIVGRSGSGKTTLTKLLQALYSVQQGLIKVDGIDIREIDKAHLRGSIGVVLQENYFFSGTIRQNISMTKRNATFEEIIYVAKLAGADEFIQKLHKGYDTVLEENASNLSGGQKQRLAIARALLSNPPILIFDEATSALDPESEHIIQQNLQQIAKGRTVLIVSHRLSIVSHAEQILVIDEGRRSELGTHEELLARPGTYQEFWKQQMSRGNGS